MGVLARHSATFRNVTNASPRRAGPIRPWRHRFISLLFRQTFPVRMPHLASDQEWALRLSGQLKTLSELAEHLTYRVLELEEGLADQDQQLTSLQEASNNFGTRVGHAMEERLEETEARLARIERLLQGRAQRRADFRTLRSLSSSAMQGDDASASVDAEFEETVFLDEAHGDLVDVDPHGDEGFLDHSLAS
jgi:hypothetical protein